MTKKKTKYAFIAALGLIITIVFIVLLIPTFDSYVEEWGSEFSMNEDYIVGTLGGIILLLAGIYGIFAEKLGNFFDEIVWGTVFAIASFYPIGVALKMYNKAMIKGQEVKPEWLTYLWIGIACFILLLVVCLLAWDKYKKSKQIEE